MFRFTQEPSSGSHFVLSQNYSYDSIVLFVNDVVNVIATYQHVCKLVSIISKHFFITPIDAHNYEIIGMLKTIKIPTIAPTCFASRRDHHQGAIPCLDKTTVMILLCSSLMTYSVLWRHTSLLCKRAVES